MLNSEATLKRKLRHSTATEAEKANNLIFMGCLLQNLLIEQDKIQIGI